MPFEHPKALAFCTYVKTHYKIQDADVYNVGDEFDAYWGSQWKKDINAEMSCKQEFNETAARLKPWYEAFPEMKICLSNHGLRWQRKALEAEIPETLLRRMAEVYASPPGWRWQKRWLIRDKSNVLVEHGDRFGGQYPHIRAVEANAVSTVIGHHHSIAGVEHVKTFGAGDDCPDEAGYKAWGMVVGSLIDFPQFAFHYAREARKKPQLGVGLTFDSNRVPFWLPLE